MSYLLSGLDLVVNNTTSIVVNTNPITIQGDIAASEKIIIVNNDYNQFSIPDNTPVAVIKSTSTATSLTNLTAKAIDITQIPISATVEGNGLKNLLTSYYEDITYTPQLLTCVGVNDTSTTIGDLSSNNVTITNNNAATASSVGPFLSSRAYRSVLFNGTNQSLTTTVATGSPLDLATGAGNWTIEGWFYVTSIAVGSRSILWKTTGAANPSYAFWISAAVPQWIIGDGAGGGNTFNLAAITANTWYHFALVRTGNTLTPYMNGVAQTGPTISSTMGNGSASTTLYIGAASDGRYFPGYISNVRIVKGSALYLGNFLPPTTNFSSASITNITTKVNAITSTTTNLIYEPLYINLYNNLQYTATVGQREIYDPDLIGNSRINSYVAVSSNKNVKSDTEIVNVSLSPEFYVNGPDAPNILSTNGKGEIGSAITTTTSAVSFGGISFNSANSQYLSVPVGASTWGTGDFTVECWFYKTESIDAALLTTASTNDLNYWGLSSYAAGNCQFTIRDVTSQILVTGTIIPPVNKWVHVAATRESGVVKLFVNGVLDASATITKTITARTTLIGGFLFPGFVSYYSGYISNVRLVTGVAVYTDNFTVPTSPLTKIQSSGTNIRAITGSQTTLLTAQGATIVDVSDLANTITNVNSVPTSLIYGPTFGGSSSISYSPGAYVSTPSINATNIEYIDYRTDPRSVNKRVKNLIVGTTGVIEELQSWS